MSDGRTLYFAIEHRRPMAENPWSGSWSLWFWDNNGGRFRTYEAARDALSGRWDEIYGGKWEGRIVRVAAVPYSPESES